MVYLESFHYRDEATASKLLSTQNIFRASKDPPFSEATPRARAVRYLGFGETNISDPASEMEKAISNRPLHATSWLHAAEIHRRGGDLAIAKRDAEIAGRLLPTRYDHLWRLALFQIGINDWQGASVSLQRYLLAKPGDVPRVLAIGQRFESDPYRLLESLLGSPDPWDERSFGATTRAISYARQTANTDLAYAAWRRIPEGEAEKSVAFGYIAFMLRQGELEEAISAWNRYQGSNAEIFGALRNGGFEKEISGGGFGWTLSNFEGGHAKRDSGVKKEGEYSLRLFFDGSENINFYHLRQPVPVTPGSSYVLRGHWRGDNVTTRSGVFFDVYSSVKDIEKNLYASNARERKTGRWDWEPFEIEFQVPDRVEVIYVRFRRQKTDALDNLLYGSVWIDGLTIEPVPGF